MTTTVATCDNGPAGLMARMRRHVTFAPTALAAMMALSLRRAMNSRRLLIVAFLLSLPSVIAGLVRYYEIGQMEPDRAAHELLEVEQVLVMFVLPHALVPLVALIYSAGLIGDEVEEQTITYLLLRPLPKWTIYACKLAASVVATSLVTAVFVALVYGVLHWQRDSFVEVLTRRAPVTAAFIALALAAYCSIFGLIGLLMKRALVIGVVYIILFEGTLANIDFLVRRGTVMYYFRVLCLRWLGVGDIEWNITLDAAPSTLTCIATLLGVSLVASLLAALIFSIREFRIKTPEGV